MGGIVNRVKDWWEGADRTQRSVTVFGVLFLVVILGLTGFFASRPRFEPLYAGLSPAEQGPVVEELRAAGIPVEVNAQGSVMVPSEKLPEAAMRLAMSGKAPAAGPQSLDLLDSINSFSTPAQERERIKAATEAKLSASVNTLKGVSSSNVHINFGKESPFGQETIPPSAVVTVIETSGQSLTQDQAKAIARLIQNSVAGLRPEGVSVISSTGRIIFDGEQAAAPGGSASRKIEAEVAESRRREIELQRSLDLAFGPGNTKVTVQVQLNMDSVSEESVSTELGDKKVTDKVTESMSDAAAGAAVGPTGLTPNTPGTSASSGGAAGSGLKYSSEVVANKYPSTERRVTTQKAAGTLTGMSISVLVNSEKVTDSTAVQAFIDSYLGGNAGEEGFSAAVQAVEFDKTQSELDQKAAASAASQAQMQQVLSILPVVALLIVGFMVVKALGKVPGRTLTMAIPNGGTMTVRGSAIDSSTMDDRGAVVRSSGEASQDGKAKTIAELAKTDPEIAEALQEMGVETIDDSVDVEAIRSRIDVPLEQIRKMGRQRPQAMAMLLKSWLMEERR